MNQTKVLLTLGGLVAFIAVLLLVLMLSHVEAFRGIMALSNISLLVGAAIAGYFIPAFVAAMRHHPETAAISLLNFFLGWTLIGWVVALVWAAKSIPARADH